MNNNTGQGFYLVSIESNLAENEISIEKISASIFPKKHGSVDTWIEIMISNRSNKICRIKSICFATDNKVNICSRANLFKEAVDNNLSKPPWSSMYRNFGDYSFAEGSFNFDIFDKSQITHYNAIPYEFDFEDITKSMEGDKRYGAFYKLFNIMKIKSLTV